MINREFWLNRLNKAWAKRSIIWLPGVRRAGKTSLCQNIPDCEYFDCELPRVRRMLEDPEDFLQNLKSPKITLDEIHRLANPSELLKIAADHYPQIKIIATGSSTLSASKKFKDTLTGRKTKIWLSPMLYHESALFGDYDIEHRLLHGGLPPFYMQDSLPEEEFVEWIEDYWAKDIQELFNIANKHSFQRFTELVLANSGNIFEATKYAAPCEVSRTTINKYLHILEQTYVAHIIKPFTSYATSEIVSAPKVYGFDTGFVCHYRGWYELRREDLGHLFEHLVLNEILGRLPKGKVRYWRDKSKHEIDFIYLKHRNARPVTIECKWSANNFNVKNLRKFRSLYPDGDNFVVAMDVERHFTKSISDIEVNFVNIEDLIKLLDKA
ncbi:MAG: ATPase [Legionellales bacterium]|nr:ATPase [Legionellales bacterium]